MKELTNFRKFLAEGVEEKKVNENELPKGDPAMEKNEIQDFLSRQFPDEWPDSWTGDLMTGTFKAPYEHIMLATNQEDVEDYFSGKEEMINQLPTEWVKVEEFTTKGRGGEDFQVMNFAKYVPGKGIYAAATTDKKLANENVKEAREVTVTDNHRAEMLRVAQDLKDIIETHDGVEGTRLLNGKMQQRDVLIKAYQTLEQLAK